MARSMFTGPQLLKRARKVLSDDRLLAFFLEAAKERHPHAAQIAQRDILKLGSLDAVVAQYVGNEEWSLHIDLKVKQEGPRTFAITFGFHGGHVGDGATYRVVYSAGSKVMRLEQTGWWIH